MPIALEKGSSIRGSGFVRGIAAKCCPIYAAAAASAAEGKDGKEDSSNSSSSIGRNSSAGDSGDGAGSDGEEESGEREVQSRLTTPLETLNSLEESLPMRRSISKFYCGKSKSFSSLSDALALPSVENLAKHENAYTRKRKNLLACSIMSNKFGNRDQTSIEGGFSKKPTNSSRDTYTPSVRSSSSRSRRDGDNHEHAHLPPRHPQAKSSLIAPPVASPLSSSPHELFSIPVRSFSLTDLQCAVNASSSGRLRQRQ